MNRHEIKKVFDKQASSYDEQWSRMAPMRDVLLFLLEAVFANLAANATILSVGTGTGEELAYLAQPTIVSIIQSAGFETPIQFFQAGLIHGWFAQYTGGNIG